MLYFKHSLCFVCVFNFSFLNSIPTLCGLMGMHNQKWFSLFSKNWDICFCNWALHIIVLSCHIHTVRVWPWASKTDLTEPVMLQRMGLGLPEYSLTCLLHIRFPSIWQCGSHYALLCGEIGNWFRECALKGLWPNCLANPQLQQPP